MPGQSRELCPDEVTSRSGLPGRSRPGRLVQLYYFITNSLRILSGTSLLSYCQIAFYRATHHKTNGNVSKNSELPQGPAFAKLPVLPPCLKGNSQIRKESSVRTAGLRNERGVALAIAVVSLVLIGALLTTTIWVGRQRQTSAVAPARVLDIGIEALAPVPQARSGQLDSLTVGGTVEPLTDSARPASPRDQ